MLGPYFVMYASVSFLVADNFAFIVFLLPCGCLCTVSLPCGAVCCSVVCNCGISWS